MNWGLGSSIYRIQMNEMSINERSINERSINEGHIMKVI